MAEPRDRLLRPVDIAVIYNRRRSEILGIFQDQPELDRTLFGSPLPRTTGTVGTGAIRSRRGGFGTPVGNRWRGRTPPRTPAAGRENMPTGSGQRGVGFGRGRASNSVLPSWYPRTPLRDITPIVRAIERRRERLGVDNGQEIGSPMLLDHGVADSSQQPPASHIMHSKSPIDTPSGSRCPPPFGKVPKILHDITNKPSGESEFLTPQKKLLNSIDTVEKAVMEELRKLKRTPSAKRAEKEKRVKTLMSMR